MTTYNWQIVQMDRLTADGFVITVHYNDMIELVGRKLMVGDVIELPHLLDYNPLNETIPTALKRFMQVWPKSKLPSWFSAATNGA